MMMTPNAAVTRAEVEDFLFHEAALLDEWRLDEWLALLTEDALYRVPSNDRPSARPEDTLFTIADDIRRIRARVVRLNDRNAHAEFPRSRTRRLISNVRIIGQDKDTVSAAANFIVFRFRRDETIREFVGHYRYRFRVTPDGLKIAFREAVIDAHELGSLGAVSFIL
jgi:p-cumate 2,3-dioxygenase beta subunit